jgi:CheY-like chemotaxis protein
MKPMKILIVDDNESITESLTEYMRLFGFETDAAQDGIEALDKLEKGQFQSVITDGHMPYMSGFDLCRLIKSRYPFIYTIGITASPNLDKFKEAGADDCFNKPVDFSLLCSLMVNRSRSQRPYLVRSGYRSQS